MRRNGKWSRGRIPLWLVVAIAALPASPGPAQLNVSALTLRPLGRGLAAASVKVVNRGNQPTAPFSVELRARPLSAVAWKRALLWSCAGLDAGAEREWSGQVQLEPGDWEVEAVPLPLEPGALGAAPTRRRIVFRVEPEEADLPRFDVNVSAPRQEIPLREVPASTQLVNEAELSRLPRSVAAEEALRLVPGVKTDNQANGERVHLSIRGVGILTERGVRGIKILLDGLPLNDPTGFAPDLFDVDWDALSRIEVLKGPAAALYGGGATGGIVSLSTASATAGPPRPSGGLFAGSHGYYKARAALDGGGETWRYQLTASRSGGQGYRDHTAFHASNAYAKAAWQASQRLELKAIAGWTDFFNQNAEGLNLAWLQSDRRMANPDALTFNEFQRTRRVSGGLTGTWRIGGAQALEFAAYLRRTEFVEAVPATVQHRTLGNPGLSVVYRIGIGPRRWRHALSLGADLQRQGIDEYRRPNLGGAVEGAERVSDQRITQSGVGLFLTDRIEIGAGWSVSVTLRRDQMRNRLRDRLGSGGVDRSGRADFARASGRFGVTWNPKPALGLYASWGDGFLPPATEELANNPAAPGGFNSGLRPALARCGEVGMRGRIGDRLGYDVSLFRLNTGDDFYRYRIPERPLETFYRNAGSTRRVGLESLLAWVPAARLAVQLAYAYSDFRYRSWIGGETGVPGNRLPNSPVHLAALELAWTPSPPWRIGFGVDAQSRSAIDATNATWVGGYALVGASIGRSWRIAGRELSLQLSGRNLFNRKYIAFTEPDPDGNSYQPGPGAEVFLGLRLR